MDLGEWNRRLVEHFTALARDRKGVPVFALEHGLTLDEIAALSRDLRADIRRLPPHWSHSLAWTVYAAEIGYGYAGDEYWQTFEENTPGWTERGTRDWIRDSFREFSRNYGGARPTGRWAEQFTIISWPITHAILPRDLQRQLAQVLYENRHFFSSELFAEPQRLGELIANRSFNVSARFKMLVQAPALVGQIAAALLFHDKEGSRQLLHPMTLKRIGDDLERERRGRDWLLAARRAFEERARVRGLSSSGVTSGVRSRDEVRAEAARLGIEPRVVLRPQGGARWEVALEIPDLSHLLERFPDLRDVLTGSRCSVAGAVGAPLARGRLFHGPQRVILKRWPRHDETLLKFERSNPQLDYLLRTECMLRPGASWLFKVASDDLAYEMRGMRVRPGSKYILMSTEPLPSSEFLSRIELGCKDVYAAVFELPDALSPEWAQALRTFRLTQTKSIEVRPAGLSAVAWDGEGHAEWYDSERPIIAIQLDYAAAELVIALRHGATLSVDLSDAPVGAPVFVELPSLSVGFHKLTVTARSRSGAGAETAGELDIIVREQPMRSWLPEVPVHGLLTMDPNPSVPSLEQLWEGEATIAINGPTGRPVKCRLRMFGRQNEELLFNRALQPITMPLSATEWSQYFEKNVQRNDDAQRAYDRAHVCNLEFSADELGSLAIRCERAFIPLRWSVRTRASGVTLRLHDDAVDEVPVVSHYSFAHPILAQQLAGSPQFDAPEGGGLYVATLGDVESAVIAPPVVKDLFSLGSYYPHIDQLPASSDSMVYLVNVARMWGKARSYGNPVSSARRAQVIRAITDRLTALIAGREWSRAEQKFTDGQRFDELERSIAAQPDQHAFIAALRAEYGAFFAEVPMQRVHRFADLLVKHRLVPPDGTPNHDMTDMVNVNVDGETALWLAGFALRLASDPSSLGAWAGDTVPFGIDKLRAAPVIVRAARFLTLIIDHRVDAETALGEMYSGWSWKE